MSGYTLSYRDKWNHPIFRNFHEAAVWAWLCDMAAWQETRVNYCGQMVTLQRGQMITSRSYIARGFDMGEQKIRTLLARLEKDGMINQLSTSHGTIITICNYGKYQDLQPADNQQLNQPPTSRQPAANHNKNKDNKYNTGNEGIESPLTPPLKKESEANDEKANRGTAPHLAGDQGIERRDDTSTGQRDYGYPAAEFTPYPTLDGQTQFEEFWRAYPKSGGNNRYTRAAYEKAILRASHETIMKGLKAYCKAQPWGDDAKYAKAPHEWLANEMWKDDYKEQKTDYYGNRRLVAGVL